MSGLNSIYEKQFERHKEDSTWGSLRPASVSCDVTSSDNNGKGKRRREYPQPSFTLRRITGPTGRCSYEIRQKLAILEYSRLICADGQPVGKRGAATVFDLDKKLLRDWENQEDELQSSLKETAGVDSKANNSTDEKPSKRQRLSDPGERLDRPGGDTEPDDDEPKVSKSRRTYPEPSFDIERAIGGRGRSSYTVETKLNVIEYTRLGCSDGAAVGNRGAANRLSLDPKRVREWVQNEVELRAAKEEKGKASARSLHKGTSPSKEKKEVHRQVQGFQRGMREARTRQARRWMLSPNVPKGRHYSGVVSPTAAY